MRPIDADLFEKILDDGLMCACESLEVYDVNIYDVFDILANMPTLEVSVPVVRCRECKWYSIYEAKKDGTPDKRYSPSVCLRDIYAKRRDPDWFCADGEREVQE